MSYDGFWPVRKIHVKCTPYKLAYLREPKSFALVVSEKVTRTMEEEPEEDLPEQEQPKEPKEKKPTLLPVYDDKFQIRLISSTSWEIQDK